ncbi:hypothetical protein BMS3Abin16_01098 [archaeon BMS3Abin16]|nr:hypothetical protein BMS3Abin16_01098 [archaeon BMS3Abin16]
MSVPLICTERKALSRGGRVIVFGSRETISRYGIPFPVFDVKKAHSESLLSIHRMTNVAQAWINEMGRFPLASLSAFIRSPRSSSLYAVSMSLSRYFNRGSRCSRVSSDSLSTMKRWSFASRFLPSFTPKSSASLIARSTANSVSLSPATFPARRGRLCASSRTRIISSISRPVDLSSAALISGSNM